MLDELAAAEDLSREAALRQALRTYQLVASARKKSYSLAFLDQSGQPVQERRPHMLAPEQA